MDFSILKLFGPGSDQSKLEENQIRDPAQQEEQRTVIQEPTSEVTANPTDTSPTDDQQPPTEESPSTPSKQSEQAHSLLIVDRKVDILLATIAELQKDIVKQVEIDKSKDEAILRFSKQLEGHELGLMRKIKESLLKEIILFYDTVERFQRKFSALEDDRLNYDLQLLKEEVEEILYRHDVVLIEPSTEAAYDRNIQKVISKERTEMASEHDQIARIFRQGFRIDDRILRKQEVTIKEYSPTSI